NLPPCPVNCVMDAWTNYSSCSMSCGDGTQTRTRNIVTQGSNGGQMCDPSMLTDTASCTGINCDCVPSAWSSWSKCNNSCGAGFQTMTRSVVRAATGTGQACGSVELPLLK